MNPTKITRPLIVDRALQIKDLAKHGTYIDGVARSLFEAIFEHADAILEEFKTDHPGGE